jgi:hypothetical protein
MAAFGFGGGHAARVALPQVFEEEYNCYSFAFQVRWASGYVFV